MRTTLCMLGAVFVYVWQAGALVSCAAGDDPASQSSQSTQSHLSAPHGGEADASGSDAPRACGRIGEPCCAPPASCEVGAFCNTAQNVCRDQHPKDLGVPCSSGSSCSSGLCGYTILEQDAAAAPDGNGTPQASPTGCTVGCFTTEECLPGWTCVNLMVGEGVCQCTWSYEQCDGLDNNCDGVIDNEPEADNWCTQMNGGTSQVCRHGACEQR